MTTKKRQRKNSKTKKFRKRKINKKQTQQKYKKIGLLKATRKIKGPNRNQIPRVMQLKLQLNELRI